jgi:hypothetical protein
LISRKTSLAELRMFCDDDAPVCLVSFTLPGKDPGKRRNTGASGLGFSTELPMQPNVADRGQEDRWSRNNRNQVFGQPPEANHLVFAFEGSPMLTNAIELEYTSG